MTPAFKNTPNITDENKDGMVKRYVHQPLVIEHYGMHATIKENGRVVISGVPVLNKENNEMEYDELEVTASFIFKLAQMLKITRMVKYVPENEAGKFSPVTRDE